MENIVVLSMDYWIGLSALDVEGLFKWNDCRPVDMDTFLYVKHAVPS